MSSAHIHAIDESGRPIDGKAINTDPVTVRWRRKTVTGISSS
jgi:hypothetical protein